MANTGSSNPITSTPISNSSPRPSPAQLRQFPPRNLPPSNSISPSKKSLSTPSPPSSASKDSTPWAPAFSSPQPASSPPMLTSPEAIPRCSPYSPIMSNCSPASSTLTPTSTSPSSKPILRRPTTPFHTSFSQMSP